MPRYEQVPLARIEDGASYHGVIEDDGEEAAEHLGGQHAAEAVHGEDEDQVIEQCRHEGNPTEAQQDEVDLHRIDDGVEMRGLVALLVDGPDGPLDDRDRELMRRDQHLELEFVAGGFDPEQARQKRYRDAAQAGLGIGDPAAEQRVHHPAGHDVAEAAAQRDVVAEGTGAEHEPFRVRRKCGGDTFDVLRVVLPVGVGGDDARHVRHGAEHVVERGLERRALAEIHGVA